LSEAQSICDLVNQEHILVKGHDLKRLSKPWCCRVLKTIDFKYGLGWCELISFYSSLKRDFVASPIIAAAKDLLQIGKANAADFRACLLRAQQGHRQDDDNYC
jgi:hypothetical protein